MKTLIVVDVQHDFIDPSGNLYVKGAEEVVPEIAKLIKKDKEIEQVIFTIDWHSPEHCSFKQNKGRWPVHCLQYTKGSTIPNILILACIQRGFMTVDSKYDLSQGQEEICTEFLSGTVDFFTKGDTASQEEYGAFINTLEMDDSDDCVQFVNLAETSYAYIPVNSDIIVSGVAGDYCVLETLINLDIPELKGQKYVFLPGIASIDGGSSLKIYCKENNIKSYEKSK